MVDKYSIDIAFYDPQNMSNQTIQACYLTNRCKVTRKLLAALSISLLALSLAYADTNQVYLEQGGFVHFEAEDAVAVSSWASNTNLNDYTGTGYLEWTGPDHFSSSSAGNGIITYHFRIESAGNYELRWRNRIAKGKSNTESNDTWVRLSTGSNVAGEEPLSGWTKVYMGEFGTWSWSARTVDHVASPVRQHFSPGDHTLEISGRSFGHAIDRIALYRYEDVNFDSGLNGTLPLSVYIKQNGSTNDPNPIVSPNPSTTEPEPEPEPEKELDTQNNVQAITSNGIETTTAYCSANTLVLPASDAVTLNVGNQTPAYTRDKLTLKAGKTNVLLAFDLSQLPTFTSAKLQYSTGATISNGSLSIYQGSNSNWVNNNTFNAPDATVLLAKAQGGWDVNSRYETSLDASLLTQTQTTLFSSVTTGSDQLSLKDSSREQPLPVLVITGNEGFCASWEANINNETASVRRSGGSLSHWIFLTLISAVYRKRAAMRAA